VLDNCHIHHAEEICQLVEDEAHMFIILFDGLFSLLPSQRMQARFFAALLT